MTIIITQVDEHRIDRPHHARPHTGRATSTHRPTVLLPWSTFGRIATATEEATFVAELERQCGGTAAAHRRSDVTALLNALRGGLTVDQLLDQAPGLLAARLFGAHSSLETLRRESEAAWSSIVETPTMRSLDAHGPEAATLLPVPVERLRRIAAMSPNALGHEVARCARAITVARDSVRRIETELDRGLLDAGRADQLSRALFDQHGDCALSNDHHLPERVGGLVPTRVAALLRERQPSTFRTVVP